MEKTRLSLSTGDVVHLMDENYDQVEVDKQIFGEQARWLIDGLDVTVDVLPSGELVIGQTLIRCTLLTDDMLHLWLSPVNV